MSIKQLASIACLSLGLLLTAGTAHASLYSFEDDDIDFVVDSGLNLKTTGTIVEGDVFVSILEIPVFTIDGANAIPAGFELTGVVAIQIEEIDGDDITFVEYSGGLNSVLALGSGSDPTVDMGGAGEGAVLAMWLNLTSGAGGDIDLDLNRTSLPATNCTSLADCIEQASLGDLFQVDGFLGDPDEFWASVSILGAGGFDIDTVLASSNTLLVAAFNFGLSNIFQDGAVIGFIDIATGLQCTPDTEPDGCVQIQGSGTITGGQGLINGAIAHSDFDAQKWSIPEPNILGLLGVGLLGMGLMTRRKLKLQ